MNTSWSELDSKIERLSDMIEGAQPVFGSPSKDDWTKVFQMCKELSEAFKEARYPKKMTEIKRGKPFSICVKGPIKSVNHNYLAAHKDIMMI